MYLSKKPGKIRLPSFSTSSFFILSSLSSSLIKKIIKCFRHENQHRGEYIEHKNTMNPQPRFREKKKSQIQLSLPPSCPFLSFYVPPLPPRPPLLLWSLLASPPAVASVSALRLPRPHRRAPPARPHAPLPFFSSPPSLAFFLSPVFLISASGSAIRSLGCTMSRVGTQYLSELPLTNLQGLFSGPTCSPARGTGCSCRCF